MIIAAAAVLWLAYLIPTWLKRREYLATERNALRLQQTLRIMAESAEIPDLIRAEATARNVAQQQRKLKQQQRRDIAIAEAELAATAREATRRLAETRPAIAADVAVTSSASRRLRRSRAITALMLLVSLVGVGGGMLQLMASAQWSLLAAASAVAIGSVALLNQMASVGRTRRELAHTLGFSQPLVAETPFDFGPQVATVRQTWTPVAIPKPLYMTRPAPERALVNSLDAAAELRQAAADAERRLREAFAASEVTPIRAAVATTTAASGTGRFARMGFVDAQSTTRTDIDAVLRRRRTLAS